MLRASFSETNPTAVIAADWSPDSQAVAYTQGPFVVVKPLIPGIAQTKVKKINCNYIEINR
jgi:hypothetical protein